MVSSILYVAVVGFHHKRGCQVEFCYPPLANNEGELPVAWQDLPSLALPDGAHNVDNDVIYFLLPSLDDPNLSVFGVSCFRQISAEDLLYKSSDVTRCTVQKSVCVLSRVPLFGALTAKLQLITKAYFNERDFAKVEVLSQMYENLCDMFPNVETDEQAAVMGMYSHLSHYHMDTSKICSSRFGDRKEIADISVQSLVTTFKHRVLVLFKLLLLEKKVVFYISPVFQLSQLMVALISLFPRLVEKGLFHAASYNRSSVNLSTEDKRFHRQEIEMEMGNDTLKVESAVEDGKSTIYFNLELNERNKEKFVETTDEVMGRMTETQLSSDVNAGCSLDVLRNQFLDTDSYGFPLSIFTKGSLFHPYLSICHLDMIRSDNTRAHCIGATNALFVQRRDLLDAIVTVDENGDGYIDIMNANLKRALTLTAADLRFIDFVSKEVEINAQSPSWEGSDDWIRLQMRAYLLSLIATVRADLKCSLGDFNESFIEEWKMTNNYRIWSSGEYPDLASTVPRQHFILISHPFTGTIGISDVLLRVEHSVGGSESGRRVASAVANTGKYFSDTSSKMRTSFTSWFKGNTRRAE
ncbi:unnamed protein product [Thelazia callipaeda]|uniref:UDENN domain-containing protein n=1 Tax=Thelazia callipaeda TaxID=103827 RepID=A0A0N5D8G2_THECL|nr:unnamed protein product [Thelazia callipaeda]